MVVTGPLMPAALSDRKLAGPAAADPGEALVTAATVPVEPVYMPVGAVAVMAVPNAMLPAPPLLIMMGAAGYAPIRSVAPVDPAGSLRVYRYVGEWLLISAVSASSNCSWLSKLNASAPDGATVP